MQEERKRLIKRVYDKFWKELYLVAFRRLGSEKEVEDMLQDIFLSLLTKEVRLETDESVRAYLHERLKSRIINFYRKKLVIQHHQEQAILQESWTIFNQEDELLSKELELMVQKEIERMPEKMKAIFLLSRKDLMTTEEIALQLNLSSQTVRNQISSAIKRIKKVVSNH